MIRPRRIPLAHDLTLWLVGLMIFIEAALAARASNRDRAIDAFGVSLDSPWFTIVTHVFVHRDMLQFALNAVFVLFAGFHLQRIIGTRCYALLVGHSVGASVLAFMLAAGVFDLSAPDGIACGATGLTAGVLAASLVFCVAENEQLPLRFVFLLHVFFVLVIKVLGDWRTGEFAPALLVTGGATAGSILAVSWMTRWRRRLRALSHRPIATERSPSRQQTISG